MNSRLKFISSFIASLAGIFGSLESPAQTMVCKDTVFYINFGAGNSPDINLSFLHDYRVDGGSCPNDGFYSFVSSTADCFGGNWLTVPEDHTPGDVNGKMMLVNSSEQPGQFFITKVNGLRGSTTYELSAWLVNVCRRTEGCKTLFPDIGFTIANAAGTPLAGFYTGEMPTEQTPAWRRYSSTFTTAPVIGNVFLQLNNRSPGGCGNDFALDDIVIKKCETIRTEPAKEEHKQYNKPVIKPRPFVSQPPGKDLPPITRPVPEKISPTTTRPFIKDSGRMIRPLPRVLLTRDNPVVKQIFTDSAEIRIDVYDNGVIDGDTVSIYHNNDLVIANAALLATPITFTIKVDRQHPHHELVMVANNLGSIPPNTSMMIVTTKDKRYEVFISSDDKRNAKVVIDLK
ncbi:MAG: hypothetical protein Q8941_10415 [Bacteroidota bacterium]|nr:hypothetical protein [Bacteroidota bacterium]